jgi:hypothetical protein
MSARVEAAAKAARLEAAMVTVREDLEHPLHHSPRRIATRVLAAADAHDAANGVHRVSLDEATMKRAETEVVALRAGGFVTSLELVRAVLAAAVKEGQ